MDFLNRIMGTREASSKNIAKERLRLVLVHDRSSVSPQLLDNIKEDMIEVISKYMEIDHSGMEVNLNSNEQSVALVANIPVIKINRLSATGRGL